MGPSSNDTSKLNVTTIQIVNDSKDTLDPTQSVPQNSLLTTNLIQINKDEKEEVTKGSKHVSFKLQHTTRANQYYAAFAANVGAIAFGTMFGWTATSLPAIRVDPTFQKINLEDSSWIGSVMIVGAMISGFVTGILMSKLGRRMTILFLSIPTLIGWGLIFFALNVEMICIGRFLTGFAGGAYSVVVPIYIAEISDANIRGILLAGFDFGLAFGFLYIMIIGSLVSWRTQAIACGILTLIGHVLCLRIPETPRYLVSKQHLDKAVNALCWIRSVNDPILVMPELKQLEIASTAKKSKNLNDCKWRTFLRPEVLKPVTVAVSIQLMSSLSAEIPIAEYAVDIFDSSHTNLNKYHGAIIFGIVDFLSAIVAALVVDRFGRRPLLIGAQFVMSSMLGLLAIFFYLQKQNGNQSPTELEWVPVTALGIFVAAFSIGTGPVSYMILGEILPLEVKGTAGGLVNIVRWLSAFLVTKYFLGFMDIFGEDIGYGGFATCCLLGGFYTIFCVPETKGKTLEEIQLQYSKNSNIP